jgi:hypothetical protein
VEFNTGEISMSFMQKEIYEGYYYEIETTAGTEIVPSGVVGWRGWMASKEAQQFCEGTIEKPEENIFPKFSWLGRMSAPGYMDCTEWLVAETEEQASLQLDELYGYDEETDTQEHK